MSSAEPNFSQPLVMYRGVDAADEFVRDLQHEANNAVLRIASVI